MTNTQPAALAHVAAPADADHVEDWRDWNGTGEYERFMHTRARCARCPIWRLRARPTSPNAAQLGV